MSSYVFAEAAHRIPLARLDRVKLAWILRVTVAGTMVGHGAFGAIMAKPAWTGYFTAAGISAEAVHAYNLVALVGWFEILFGLLALFQPIPILFLSIFVWKVGTELLRPMAGEPFFEVVERASNLLAPLVIMYVQGWPRSVREWLTSSTLYRRGT